MERREFLKSLGLGLGAAVAATQARAFTRMTPPEDIGDANIEKTLGRGYWRHRKARSNQYGGQEYGSQKKK